MSNEYQLPCPFCKEIINTTIDFLILNDRVCCMNCNKAFDVQIKEQPKAKPQDDFGGYDGSWD